MPQQLLPTQSLADSLGMNHNTWSRAIATTFRASISMLLWLKRSQKRREQTAFCFWEEASGNVDEQGGTRIMKVGCGSMECLQEVHGGA